MIQKNNKRLISFCITVLLAATLGFYLGRLTKSPESIIETTPNALNIPEVTSKQPAARSRGIKIGENTIADIAASVAKSVVNIDTQTSVVVSDMPYHFDIPFGGFDFFFGSDMRMFNGNSIPRKFEGKGTGSGVIIRSDGYILTNNHVVRNANDIKVTLADKRVYKGTIVERDSYTDLALIKIDAKNLTPAKMGESKNLRPGDWAIAIGSPLGLDHTVTFGIVSAIGRYLFDSKSQVELIQTDAAINPGNSGGPLLDIAGEVIGINTAIRSDAQNIGFAIPIDEAKNAVNDLFAHKRMNRPYLGIYMQTLDAKTIQAFKLSPNSEGVLIVSVAPNGPARHAGLLEGDIIERIDGVQVSAALDVKRIIHKCKLGQVINVLISRKNVLRAIAVRIDQYPENNNLDEDQ